MLKKAFWQQVITVPFMYQLKMNGQLFTIVFNIPNPNGAKMG